MNKVKLIENIFLENENPYQIQLLVYIQVVMKNIENLAPASELEIWELRIITMILRKDSPL